ncbi:MAG: asparagine synthase (glutamine-hydrolyzing), partial [Candidatus Omnitrophota bacterium]
MCGIAGSCNFRGEKADAALIKRMIDSLAHRGPDDEGIYLSATARPQSPAQTALGHRRLSIIDLNTGHQPMTNEDSSLWIVFNGEIYNFLLLKEELLTRGHRFQTRSDTEVILHLYEEYGPECVEKLRGMFAFALWDNNKERLFLARDRVGKKPLAYYYDGKNFFFASEIKALLQHDLPRQIDNNAINYYLTYGYIPSPQSILKGIKKLPPAHILLLDKNGLTTKRYWQITYRKRALSFGEAKDRFKSLLAESVKLRLISDVPLGAFLSGGMDSSSVVAVMSSFFKTPVKTFTIGFEEADYSEVEFARQVAKRYGTEHHEFVVRPNAFEVLNKLVWHYNEPFGDSSSIPTYYLAKLTREFVPVALNGDGGDESLAGYERYRGLRIGKPLEYLPRPLINLLISLFKTDRNLFNRMAQVVMNVAGVRATPRYIEGLLMGLRNYSDQWRRYISWVSYFQDIHKQELYRDDFKARLNEDVYTYILDLARHSRLSDPAEKAMEVDINSYLPEDLLVKMDIATMAHALEARSPFLDHELMEFTASLPMHYKLHFLKPKHILKEVVKDIIPPDILKRKKMGFGVPLDKWFRQDLKDFSYQVLLEPRSIGRGYFKKEYIQNLLDEHCAGTFNHGAR